jgi:regulatory protein
MGKQAYGGGRSASSDGPSSQQIGGEVTRLEVRRGVSDRLVVHLNGEPALELSAAVIDQERVGVGMTLTADDVQRLLAEDEPYRARSRSLALLAAKDRASSEIESRLKRLGFKDEAIVETVSWLRERDYLDDARFIERFADEKRRCGWGQRRIVSELLRKGLERSMVNVVVAEHAGGSDDDEKTIEELALLVGKRFGARLASDPIATSRKMAAFLARRGHDWHVVRIVTAKVCEEYGYSEGAEAEDQMWERE